MSEREIERERVRFEQRDNGRELGGVVAIFHEESSIHTIIVKKITALAFSPLLLLL